MFLKLAPFKNKAVETTFCYQFLFVFLFWNDPTQKEAVASLVIPIFVAVLCVSYNF